MRNAANLIAMSHFPQLAVTWSLIAGPSSTKTKLEINEARDLELAKTDVL